MKRGKRICNELKAVRRRIADENGIPLQQPECTHTGECRGTCPRCEAEVRYLEQALSRRLAVGKAATVAGLTLSLAACGGGKEKIISTDSPLDTSRTMQPVSGSDTIPADSTYVEGIDDPIIPLEVTGDMGIIEDIDTSQSSVIRQGKNPTVFPDDALIEEGEISPMDYNLAVDEEASFPGGEDALNSYISSHLQYPEQAKEEKISGTVVIKFCVEKDGSISGVKILRDIGGGCGKEAQRVVKNMPKWIPARMNGEKIRREVILPIRFE